MKKRLISAAFLIIMCVSAFNVSVFADIDEAADIPEKVEISFYVGDAALLINGTEVVVEKPYVVGEGVTLVPVRVITEAFGAVVEWVAETKTVTLTYPDVNIVLQIDNPIAEVNGIAESLLSAPELTPNGFTMVPLRFISENFGAEVTYDNETKLITVTKSTATEEGEGIVGEAIDSAYIGDSYYGWQIENNDNMLLYKRWFDGRSSSFVFGDQDGFMNVSVYQNLGEYDVQESLAYYKDASKGYTLVIAETGVFEGYPDSVHVRTRDGNEYVDVYEVCNGEYIFEVFSEFYTADKESRNEFFRIACTFRPEFDQHNTYDFSNVTDGNRRFEAESIGYSFDVPAEFEFLSDEDEELRLEFEKYSGAGDMDYSSIYFEMFSKESVGGAQELAGNDRQDHVDLYNKDFLTITEVAQAEYAGLSAYEYIAELSEPYDIYTHDVFFEVGEYVYNFYVRLDNSYKEREQFAKSIFESIVIDVADVEEIGNILYNCDRVDDSFTTVDYLRGCTFKVPADTEEITVNEAGYVGSFEHSGIVAMIIPESYSYIEDLDEYVEVFLDGFSEKNAKLLDKKKFFNNGILCYEIVMKSEENGEMAYSHVCMAQHKDYIYIFVISTPELNYSDKTAGKAQEIIDSIEFIK